MGLFINWMVVGLPLLVVVFLGINAFELEDNETGKIFVDGLSIEPMYNNTIFNI